MLENNGKRKSQPVQIHSKEFLVDPKNRGVILEIKCSDGHKRQCYLWKYSSDIKDQGLFVAQIEQLIERGETVVLESKWGANPNDFFMHFEVLDRVDVELQIEFLKKAASNS